ncbi:hypothetical protein, partial [Falsiroseomonas oryziterrae]|uniref:hypothetical protein n=1 Tax=Falsiroseomonas oryziterrae TaxID=2911368 RepID=UPI001F223381
TTPRRDLLPALDAFAEVLVLLESGPSTPARLTAAMPAERAVRTRRALAWMLKMDLLRLA